MMTVPIAFVHHANQLVITNGYDNRDGISTICAGYARVLDIHDRYGVPCSLHLSGTLLEAALWHEPWFVRKVRELVDRGVCTLVGGTYSEPIMPTLSYESNLRQLATMQELLARHFPDVPQPRTAWIPERVWSPQLHSVLTDPTLPHGAFERVLVDDRLMLPKTRRQEADHLGVASWGQGGAPELSPELTNPELFLTRCDADPRPLTFVPICSHLRYAFPPRDQRHYEFLEWMIASLDTGPTDGALPLLTYADDMERPAGVGGWEPALEQYEHLMTWVREHPALEVVELDGWLDWHPAPERGRVDAGTYYELEVVWGAGADYRGWIDDEQCGPYLDLLDDVEGDLAKARVSACDDRLVALAERLHMIGQHQTGWRDAVDQGHRSLAPWVRATAAHTRLCRPLLRAAEWGASEEAVTPHGEWVDVDGDGEQELFLANDTAWCLVTPRWGARLVMMAHRTSRPEPGSRRCSLIVGNPADHWNFQEELHRFMDHPPAHPGALTEAHAPHEEWHVTRFRTDSVAVVLDLVRSADPRHGSRRYAVIAGLPGLAACLHLDVEGSEVTNLVVPDYLRALTEGMEDTGPRHGDHYVTWATEHDQCWIVFGPDQATSAIGEPTAAGHGHAIRLLPRGRHLDLVIGGGETSDDIARARLSDARRVLHSS